MAPKPRVGTRPIDIALPRPRAMQSVAIAITGDSRGGFGYAACSAQQCWGGNVDAECVDTALLDVIKHVREACDVERIRFLVQVPVRSTLWALRDEIALLMPGVWIERPKLSDAELMRNAIAGLRPIATTVPTEPVVMATDGSVRGRYTGYGWLASSGDFGLQGFRHSQKLIGPKVVLVAELRAIGAAVQQLRGRDITILSDSKLAVPMVRRWMAGDDTLPEGYSAYRQSGKTPGLVRAQRLLREERARITVMWTKGHRGEPLNEGADALARLASRYALGDSGLDGAEYHRRAKDLAETFSREFSRDRETSTRTLILRRVPYLHGCVRRL